MPDVKSSLTVHVTAAVADKAGRRLVELRTEPVGSLVIAGSEHRLDEITAVHSLHKHPIFFWQEGDGRISEVLHHPEEEHRPLQEKKALLSYLQLPTGTSEVHPTGTSVMERDEEDVNGMVTARYRARRGLLRRLVVQKSMLWHPSSMALRQTGWKMDANATAIVDSPTGVVRSIRWQSRIVTDLRPRHPEEETDHEGVSEGIQMLPDEPTTVTWTLAQSGKAEGLPESLSRRRLRLHTSLQHELARNLFVSTGLVHDDLSVTAKEMREDPDMQPLGVVTGCALEELDHLLKWLRSGAVQRWKNDGELVHRIRSLALCPPRHPDWDPADVMTALTSELLQSSGCLASPTRTPAVCAVLLNALGLIDNPESHLALATFISQANGTIFDQAFVAVIAAVSSPSPPLLDALAGVRVRDSLGRCANNVLSCLTPLALTPRSP